jgi:hypothetical protein
MFAGTWLTTPAIAPVKTTFIWISVICALSGGLALTGIPEFVRGGYLTEGCYVDGESSLDSATPAQTSSRNPFDVTRDDDVVWTAESDVVFTNWDSGLGLLVGGFGVPVWNGFHENSGETQFWADVESTKEHVDNIEQVSGLRASGIYHLIGDIDADEGYCELSAYVRIQPDHPFDGVLLIVLWLLTAGSAATLAVVAYRLRRSLTPPVEVPSET